MTIVEEYRYIEARQLREAQRNHCNVIGTTMHVYDQACAIRRLFRCEFIQSNMVTADVLTEFEMLNDLHLIDCFIPNFDISKTVSSA